MEKPRFQFRLRTIFVVMAVVAALSAVAVPVTRYVIRERDEAYLREAAKILKEYVQNPANRSP